jgi:hypothetical protein
MLEDNRRRTQLSPEYFAFIEAVEFTRRHDDGANPDGWHQCDLLIIGVSRFDAALLHACACNCPSMQGRGRFDFCTGNAPGLRDSCAF